MSLTEIEERLAALEREVEGLKNRPPERDGRWWVETAGAFKDDPMFDEMVRLGREYRESLRPPEDVEDAA